LRQNGSKIFTENWVSKQSFFCFDIDNGLKNIFFRNKTFSFFKIESWNFQHLFETEFCETSQNVNSIRQLIEKNENNNCLNELNELKLCEVPQNFILNWDAESFSFLSWKTKKFYSPKKYLFGCRQYQNIKALFTDSIFRDGFGKYCDENSVVTALCERPKKSLDYLYFIRAMLIDQLFPMTFFVDYIRWHEFSWTEI
jgi:hypothetical protein